MGQKKGAASFAGEKRNFDYGICTNSLHKAQWQLYNKDANEKQAFGFLLTR